MFAPLVEAQPSPILREHLGASKTFGSYLTSQVSPHSPLFLDVFWDASRVGLLEVNIRAL
jgi:hypothetical protein